MRRITPILLAAGLLAGGLTTGFRWSGAEETRVDEPMALMLPQVITRRVAQESFALRSAEHRTAALTQMRVAVPVAAVNAEEAALVAEMCGLQLLAQGTDLALDSRQWAALAAVTSKLQAVRQTYEAGLATATVVAPGRYRLEVPSYAGVGAAIRKQFYAEIGAALGEERAAAVLDTLGGRFEGYFGGFGVSQQTLEITGDPRIAPADCAVTRTVTYVSESEGIETLVTRSETHLPTWEDPSGERWAALLDAALNAAGAGRAAPRV